jgi:hypothetical protein
MRKGIFLTLLLICVSRAIAGDQILLKSRHQPACGSVFMN